MTIANDMSIKIRPIGVVHSSITEPDCAPIQPVFAEGSEGVVEVFEPYKQALKDLEGFERIWLLYWFHKARKSKLLVKPYMDTTERGLFATRAPCRPNPIGISAVRLLRISGHKLYVADIDILDNTPLLDIKPYVPKFDHFEVKRIGWIEKAQSETKLADNRFFEKQ
jgi:tRNA-Thr(GGU) m(6)t(6)A37 methyltransferase TsaA